MSSVPGDPALWSFRRAWETVCGLNYDKRRYGRVVMAVPEAARSLCMRWLGLWALM